MPIGKANSLRDLKPQVYADVFQLAGNGGGFFVVETEIDEYATVAQELRGEVLLTNRAKEYNAGQREQTSCRERPRMRPWPAKVVAANDDGMEVTGLEQLNVTDQFRNVAVGLDAMDTNHLHSVCDVPC